MSGGACARSGPKPHAPLWALAADAAGGEPPTPLHPVGWMGRVIGAGRATRRSFAPLPSLLQGALLVAGGAAACWLAAGAAERALGRLPAVLRTPAAGLALKPALALRALLDAGHEVERALRVGDLPEARRLLAWHLVSRDTAALSKSEVCGAAIESLAENLSDSWVAPLLAHRLAGLPGAYLYRWVNTCDAMLGYRTPELEWFGKSAARVDDALGWLPARLAAALIAAAAAAGGGSGPEALQAARRDARRTASPNAGWPMAAMAGALEVRLVKRGAYTLNPAARDPEIGDLARARRITRTAGLLAAVLAGA